MSSCLFYNVYVASSVTTQGRAFIAASMLCCEMFLNNNVKFGSLDQVIDFINNIVNESNDRRFDDYGLLDRNISVEECFAKVVLTCGYKWTPKQEDLDIIWTVLQNIGQGNLNRIYYKNNLYEFLDNTKVFNIVQSILTKLETPFYNSLEPPAEVINELKLFTELLEEYVYYRYLVMDRIDRCLNMIKSVIAVSDTDSAIVSLDGWYRYVANKVSGVSMKIANYTDKYSDEKPVLEPKVYRYNHTEEEDTENEHFNNPGMATPADNVKYSIIAIMAYVLGIVLNDYMEKACENHHSLTLEEVVRIPITLDDLNTANEYQIPFKRDRFTLQYIPKKVYKYNRKCKMFMKTEFLFQRIMITDAKKHYASLQILQEGNMIPEDQQLDIKGIDIMLKSTVPLYTRNALKKILLEDIMKAPVIDQIKILKDIQQFEKDLIQTVKNGGREYYKPATVKSIDHYADPMRIQGIKASIAWNSMKTEDYPTIDLNIRNAIDIAKVTINKGNADHIAADYPEVYNNILALLDNEAFKNGIDAVAIPSDCKVPEWITEFVDYDTLLRDNINPFPLESVGITKLDRKNVAYTNIVQL